MQFNEFTSFLKARGVWVFTISDAADILGKSRQYAAKFMQGRQGIGRIEKGRYYLEGASEDIIASHIAYPSYLSMVTAFRFYNLTTQLPIEKYVITTVQHRPLVFNRYRIRFIKVSKRLLFGFEAINGTIVATPEKAFIDTLYIRKRAWYTEEFDNGLKKNVIDISRLKGYAVALGSPGLVSRLGHFLEGHCGINCDDILTHSSKRYVKMSGTGRAKDRKWHVIYDGRQ